MPRWRMPSPRTWSRVHGTLCVIWAVLMIPSIIWWKDSLLWVIAMSCYANFAGSVAGWTAAKADANSPTVEQLDRLERKVIALQRMLAARR